MSEPNRPPKSDVLRFADGELHNGRADAVRDYLAADECVSAEVAALQRLRESAKQSFDARTPAMPDDLRAALEAQINAATQVESGIVAPSPSPMRIHAVYNWRVAAAVLLMVGLAGSWFMYRGVFKPDSNELLRPTDSIVSAAHQPIVTAVTRKHQLCERMKDHFYDKRFPRTLVELPSSAKQYLGGDAPIPDLDAMGYEFAGAGGCTLPGGTTLHIMYKSKAPPHRYASIFIQRFGGQVDLQPGQVVILAASSPDNPLVCWRTGDMICYLICDDAQSFEATAGALRLQIPS